MVRAAAVAIWHERQQRGAVSVALDCGSEPYLFDIQGDGCVRCRENVKGAEYFLSAKTRWQAEGDRLVTYLVELSGEFVLYLSSTRRLACGNERRYLDSVLKESKDRETVLNIERMLKMILSIHGQFDERTSSQVPRIPGGHALPNYEMRICEYLEKFIVSDDMVIPPSVCPDPQYEGHNEGAMDRAAEEDPHLEGQGEAAWLTLEESKKDIKEMNEAIERLGGCVVPKLWGKVPTDATWVFGNTVSCRNAMEVLMLLKCSTRVADSRASPSILRMTKFLALNDLEELRLYVVCSVVVAAEQRYGICRIFNKSGGCSELSISKGLEVWALLKEEFSHDWTGKVDIAITKNKVFVVDMDVSPFLAEPSDAAVRRLILDQLDGYDVCQSIYQHVRRPVFLVHENLMNGIGKEARVDYGSEDQWVAV